MRAAKLTVMVRAEFSSLRFSPRERRWLTLALMLSLFVHLGAWGGYEAGKKFGWWERVPKQSRTHPPDKKNSPPLPPSANAEPPLVFVDVSHVEPAPPKNTKYYSDKNSAAANPEAQKDLNQPKLAGKQKDIPKTENVPQLPKLAPAPPKTAAAEPAEVHPSSPENLGDIKPDPKREPKPDDLKPVPPRERPRTLKAAQAQQQLPGQQLQQEGGVRRQQLWSSLDVKATPFGEYDRAIVEAVTQHWYDLLDSRRFALDRSGKVILHFKLKSDGTVGEMKILANDTGTTLGYVCESAVQEAAPFAKWPVDMKRMIGANFREITFTFYYY